MAKVERYGSAHECLAYLLHEIGVPGLAAIAAAAENLVFAPIVEWVSLDPRIEIAGLTKAAHPYVVDLVYAVTTADGRRRVWVIEVELSFSLLKIDRWSLYEIVFQTEQRCDARVVVWTPEPRLRGRIRTRILPRMKTKPIVIEPDQIERITDYADARARPEYAVLGALFHAHEPAPMAARVEVFRAAWMAIQSLAEPKARRYSVAVMSIVPQPVIDQGIAELREAGALDEEHWELFSEVERGGHSFARGREEGRIETLRRAIVDVLELRGIAVSAEARERIDSCASLATLERWYAATKTAAASIPIDELLALFE